MASTSSDSESKTEEAFGSILMRCMREEGLPASGFKYATIQELKSSDRAGAIRALRSACGSLSYNLIQRIKQDEPEVIAQHMAEQYRLAAKKANAASLLLAILSCI